MNRLIKRKRARRPKSRPKRRRETCNKSVYLLLVVSFMAIGFLLAPRNYANTEIAQQMSTAPQAANTTSSSELARPVSAMTITSDFGPRESGNHRGVDLAMPKGSPIYAVNSGKVILSSRSKSYGNYIKLDHGGGMITVYAHLEKRLVKKGEQIKKKQLIVTVGDTGNTTGPHLHFEVILSDRLVDPMNYL